MIVDFKITTNDGVFKLIVDDSKMMDMVVDTGIMTGHVDVVIDATTSGPHEPQWQSDAPHEEVKAEVPALGSTDITNQLLDLLVAQRTALQAQCST